jgi:periplasmic divalent cation tolerance protein
MSDPTVQVVLCTCPADAAQALSHALVGERLAACVNVVAGVVSVYRWQGAIAEDAESLLVIKTAADRLSALQARLTDLHPYDVPEILALDVAAGAAAYLAWVVDGTRPGGPAAEE